MRGTWTPPIGKGFAAVALASASAAGLYGCDPVLNIAGANFPAWLACGLAGALLTALIRPLFVAFRIEAYLWPLPLVYLSLGVVMACIVYLIFFNRI